MLHRCCPCSRPPWHDTSDTHRLTAAVYRSSQRAWRLTRVEAVRKMSSISRDASGAKRRVVQRVQMQSTFMLRLVQYERTLRCSGAGQLWQWHDLETMPAATAC